MRTSPANLQLAWVAAVLAASILSIGCSRESVVPGNLPQRSPAIDSYNNYMVLYGDPHVHTNLSDGDESPDFALRYARDVAKLDWCCITDHSEMMAADNNVALGYYRSIPSKYDQPGKFCVLFGYEWTSAAYDHRSILTLDSTIPIVSCNDPNYDVPSELWKSLENYDVVGIPHHPMMQSSMNWWEYFNPDVERCVEFYSKWGMSLYDGNPRPLADPDPNHGVYKALAEQGLRFGLTAGTDTHMTRPGSHLGESRPPDTLKYAQPGLTGVWASAFTRDAIYNALKNRRCYGMTGTRVMLQFAVNGHVMGSEISSADPPQISVEASSKVLIQRVVILKISGQQVNEIKTFDLNAAEYEGSFVDDQFTDDAAYLVRVDLVNTDLALSSPIWVTKDHSGGSVF